MVKGVTFFLLLMFSGVTVFGNEDAVDIATIEKDLRNEIIKSAAPTVVNEKYEYYEIRGNSEKELRSQMSQNGTKWNDGKTYDALTSWSWNWDYGYDRTPEGCLIDSFKTDISITFRYPKWIRADENAPAALVEKWESYMQNLILHENGHRDMAVEAAREFSDAVAQLPPADSCADLDRQVKALGTERMAKLNSASVEYDATTIHGSTQGAVFP